MTYKFQELPYHIVTWTFADAKNTNRKALAQSLLKPFFIVDKALRQPKNSVFEMLPYEFDDLKEIVRNQTDHHPQIREIISFKSAVVFKTFDHGEFIFTPLSQATIQQSCSGDEYFKIQHYDPYWGTLYVFKEDIRLDKPGYKWWEAKESERLSYFPDDDDLAMYVVIIDNEGNADHHVIRADIDSFEYFVKGIDVFPGLSKNEFEKFGWWFNDKVRYSKFRRFKEANR